MGRQMVTWSVLLAGACLPGEAPPLPAVGRALLSLDREAPAGVGASGSEKAGAARELGRLIQGARARLSRHPDQHPVDLINRLLFEELGFQREVEDSSVAWMLLPRVIRERRGSCLGLAGLYLALGQAVDLPLRGVLVPGHFFVRFGDGAKARDVELLKGGRQMPRGWYLRKYNVPRESSLYLHALRHEQSLAVFRYNLANAHRARGDLGRALSGYRRVVSALPDFAEAQANLGLTLHRLGLLDQAEQAYSRAEAAHPGLTGLEHNRAVLRRERTINAPAPPSAHAPGSAAPVR